MSQEDKPAAAQEPVARLLKYIGNGVYPKSLNQIVARTYEELPEGMYSDTWADAGKLYTAPQPVAAQEPVAWQYELADSINRQGEYCNWVFRIADEKPNVPDKSIRNLKPLYANAAPCARCAELEAQIKDWKRGANAEAREVDAAHAKVSDQAAEIERLRVMLPGIPKRERECKTLEDWRVRALHLESQYSSCSHGFNVHASKQAARIKELEAEVERQRKVIKLCKEAMTWDVGGEPLPTLEVEALAAIADLEKGVV